MATIKEDYCSKEIYRLLIEKGFDGEIHTTFDKEGYTQPSITHQMAMKWLREKGFHINASISYDYSEDADGNIVDKWTFWLFEIFSLFGGDIIYTEEVNEYDSYEEAVEAALKYCLENLI